MTAVPSSPPSRLLSDSGSRPTAIILVLTLALWFTVGVAAALAAAILLTALWLVSVNRLFSVEAYLCLVAIYYWLGIANPFRADVHQVTISSATTHTLVLLVTAGVALLWLGSRIGMQSAARSPSRTIDPSVLVQRLYRSAYVSMGLGASIAAICYLRFGVPALSSSPDMARADFIAHLSPFTYYQWLLMEVGIGLGVLAMAKDLDPTGTRRRRAMTIMCAAMVLVVGGVLSRVTIGTPLMLAAIVWWSQGRRIPWALVGIGGATAVAVVGVVWILRVQVIGDITLYNVDFNFGGGLPAAVRAIAAAVTIFARTSVEVFAMFVQGTLPKLHGEVALMSIISLLPGHHPGLGLFHVSALLGYDADSGTTVSLFGGMYADFGTLGVVAISPFLGWLLGYLERRSTVGNREFGLYYGIVLAYFINMIYGGQLLDVTLLWKLWLAVIALRFVRTGSLWSTRAQVLQVLCTAMLYGYGLIKLLLA